MRSACLPRHPAVAYLCLVSSTKMHPTPEQIRQALPHIRYEIESFLQTPAHDSHNEALQESVYFRKMAHCRALYHFFRKPLSERQDRRKKWMMTCSPRITAFRPRMSMAKIRRRC